MKDEKKYTNPAQGNQSALEIAKACLNIPDGTDYQPPKKGEESEIEKALLKIFHSLKKDET